MDIVKYMIRKALTDAGEQVIDYDMTVNQRAVDIITMIGDEIRFYSIIRDGGRQDLHTWFDAVAVRFAAEVDDIDKVLAFYAIKIMNINQKNITIKKIRYV